VLGRKGRGNSKQGKERPRKFLELTTPAVLTRTVPSEKKASTTIQREGGGSRGGKPKREKKVRSDCWGKKTCQRHNHREQDLSQKEKRERSWWDKGEEKILVQKRGEQKRAILERSPSPQSVNRKRRGVEDMKEGRL